MALKPVSTTLNDKILRLNDRLLLCDEFSSINFEILKLIIQYEGIGFVEIGSLLSVSKEDLEVILEMGEELCFCIKKDGMYYPHEFLSR
jgi:hypothetical protein